MSNFKNQIEADLNTMSYSFKKGFDKLKRNQVVQAKADLMKGLGLTTESNLYRRIRGEVVPRVNEVRIIEEVFAKYGITDIWGEA